MGLYPSSCSVPSGRVGAATRSLELLLSATGMRSQAGLKACLPYLIPEACRKGKWFLKVSVLKVSVLKVSVLNY